MNLFESEPADSNPFHGPLYPIPGADPNARFNGPEYDHERDHARLTGQILRVWEAIRDGAWYTLAAIAKATGDPEASISAQLRHLRKRRFGAHDIERDYLGDGLYRYRCRDSSRDFNGS